MILKVICVLGLFGFGLGGIVIKLWGRFMKYGIEISSVLVLN